MEDTVTVFIVMNFCRSVSCHTFTVMLLARHMENSGQTPAEMLDALEENGITALNEEVSMPGCPSDQAYKLLIRMFRMDHLPDEEKKVLQLLAIQPSEGIPPMEFKAHAGLSSTRTLVSLEKRGWIIRMDKGIALHPVVRMTVQYSLIK